MNMNMNDDDWISENETVVLRGIFSSFSFFPTFFSSLSCGLSLKEKASAVLVLAGNKFM